MDRPKRVCAAKVHNYRKYHLSGDLDQLVQGKVTETIERLGAQAKMSQKDTEETQPRLSQKDTVEATPEQLQDVLDSQRENSSRLQQQVAAMKLRNEIEVEEMQQQQWECTLA